MNKLLKKFLLLCLASTVAFASVGGVGCKNNNDKLSNGDNTEGNVSVLEKTDLEISISQSLSLVLGEEKSAGVLTKNINGDVVYSVNNDGRDVVTFESGIVKAIGVGSAIVTASFGSVSASCHVSVTYGNFIPSLELVSNVTEGVHLSLGSSNLIAAYIIFNGIIFEDATLTFSSDNKDVVSVSSNGLITANKLADEPVNVTVSANWRDFNSNEYATLIKTFKVYVRNDVTFLVNGKTPDQITVSTPATFLTPLEHNNVVSVVPSVMINGVEKQLSSSNISVIPLGDTQCGKDFLWDGESCTFFAYRKGKVLVELTYELDGDVFSVNFEILISRPKKVLTNIVKLFSARSGLYKVDNGDGTYVDQALEMAVWGKDVTLVDAYSDGVALSINNSNGAITGLEVNQDTETYTTIILGTDTDLIEVPILASAYYMSNAQDVKNALEQIGLYEEIRGYHKVICDIDMIGVALDNRIDSSDDLGAVRYSGYRIDGAYIDSTSRKEIGFNGVFDGDGHTIYNANVELASYKDAIYTKYPFDNGNGADIICNGNNRSYGFFHNVLSEGIIKNVAFENFGGNYVQGDQNALYGLVSPLSYTFSGTLQNVYINVKADNPTSRGIITNICSTSVFQNVLVEFDRPKNYDFATNIDNLCNNDLYAFGYGSFSNGIPNSKATYNGVYVISKMPLAFDTTRGFSSNDTSSVNAITYGENETELIYKFSAFDIVHGAVNHTVKSTVGDHLKDDNGNVIVTGKTKVFKGIQRYNTYQDLANCKYEHTPERSALFATSKYWTLVGNVPIWHSLLDKHSYNYTATIGGKDKLAINLYDEQPIEVALYGEFATNVRLTENSDLIEISDNNVIKGVKIGTGAEVFAEFIYFGKIQTLNFAVDVLYPFYLTINDEIIKDSTFQPRGKEFNVSVMINGNLVTDVKFTSDSPEALMINDSTLKGIAYKNGIVVTAEFLYRGERFTQNFSIDILDMIAKETTVSIDGKNVENEEFSLVIDDKPSVIEINSDKGDVNILSVSSSNDNFVVKNNMLQANLYGESIISFTFAINGETHVKSIICKAIYPSFYTEITSIVEYDAYDGKLITSEIDETGVVFATVLFGNDTIILTRENGGITEDGLIRGRLTNGDLFPCVPTINNGNSTFNNAKLIMTVGTYKRVYTLTAQYYTSIIEDAQELKEALDIDYTVRKNNLGFYRLGNDVCINPTSPLIFDYVGASSSIISVNSDVGFAGLFFGCGYTIDFNCTDVGAYGLFGNFNYSDFVTLNNKVIVKDFAIINYNSKHYSVYSQCSPVLGRFTKNNGCSNSIEFKDLYVSYASTACPNGLIVESGNSATYENIFIDSSLVTGKVDYLSAEYGNAQGMISPFSGFTGGVLFGGLRYVTLEFCKNLKNVIALGELPLVKSKNIDALSSNLFIHTANDDGTYTHTVKGSGYLGDCESYFALPGNKQDVAILQGLRSELESLLSKNSGTPFRFKYCQKCFGTFTTGISKSCSIKTCGATLVSIYNAWVSPVAFEWTFNVSTYVNPENTSENAVIVFKGVSKYDTILEMIASGNEFLYFALNSLWSVKDSTVSWLGK